MSRASSALFVLVVLIVAACASSGDEPPNTTPTNDSSVTTTQPGTDVTNDSFHLVVVGDSIPFAGFCPGCEGFVDQFAGKVEATTGRTVEVANWSRNDSANLAAIKRQVTDDGALRELLATADIVLVSVGYNDQLPWPTDRPCHSEQADTAEAEIAAVLLYTDSCIDATIESYREDYEALFGEISALVPQPSMPLALTVYNNWLGYPGIEEFASADQLDQIAVLTKRTFDGWNTMLCDAGTAYGFACVDVYHAFNGDDGTEAAGDNLGDDYSHPSQQGNTVIADLLADIDLEPVTG